MEKNMTRRDFLKVAGTSSIALGAVAATGCSLNKSNKSETTLDVEGGKMEYRTNSKNGDKVSLLGFGCMRWPMIPGKNGEKDKIDQDAVNKLVDFAYKHGVNYYDTSPAYLQGQSETAAGIALSRYPRKSYYIATKLSNFNAWDKDASLKMYHDSFEQLRTDYFDYYLLHAIGGGGVDVFNKRYVDNGLMDFLMKEREAGRIRNLGFSFHGTQDAFDYFIAQNDKYHWDFVQIEMNYLDWQHAKAPDNVNADYLYEQIDKLGLPIVVMEPLLGGRLVNVPSNVADKLKEREPQNSIASWAFRFAGSYPRVLTALSGMESMGPLEDNLNTFRHFKPLNAEEIKLLKDLADMMDKNPTIPCNYCKYCMPCPYGVNIPEIFKHYNRAINEGFKAESKEQADYQKLRRKYLISYDRAIESLRQANHCIGCHQCEPHCPQTIKIPTELKRIDNYIEKLKRGTLEAEQ